MLAETDDWVSYSKAMDTICRGYVIGKHNTLRTWNPTVPSPIEGCSNLARSGSYNVPRTGFGSIARQIAKKNRCVLRN